MFMLYQYIKVPSDGEPIRINDGRSLTVPNNPIIPYIVGDGVGVDITPVMIAVVDAAVAKAYGDRKRISWMEMFIGERAAELYDGDWYPAETLDAIKEYVVAIKGPLTTPVGGGFRSLNIALRQELDLYTNLRPVRWFSGVPAPLRAPENTNVVVFRENSEDSYAGIEWRSGSAQAQKLIRFLQEEMGVTKIRFPEHCGIGIKPASKEGSQRLIRKALQYTIDQDLPSLSIVHKGNIMKFTEGAFRDWGYELAVEEFGATLIDGGPWASLVNPTSGTTIIIKDIIVDTMLQQLLLRPEEYSVIATMNLNGDHLSDMLAAQVGGIGIAPGANLSDSIALFEATHGTAPKYAGLDKVNPSSLILSAEMMLRHIGWNSAADRILTGMNGAIGAGTVTYDFARSMEGATLVSCSGFGAEIIKNM